MLLGDFLLENCLQKVQLQSDLGLYCFQKNISDFHPIALRKAKIVYNFVLSGCNRLTLEGPITTAADNIHKYFFHFFSEKIRFDISSESGRGFT